MDEKETKKTRRRDEKEKKKTGKNHRRHFSSTNSVSVIVINYDILHWVNYLGITILTGFEL